jgi:hypothetical protein
LLDDYEVKGVSGLEEWDLTFLGTMSFDWWVNHSCDIELRNVRREALVKWIEHIICRSTEASWWATVLVCEWLSRSDPDEMENLWFDLCTLPPGFAEKTRQLLLSSLKVLISENISS